MASAEYLLRAPALEMAAWQAQAAAQDLSFAQWLRRAARKEFGAEAERGSAKEALAPSMPAELTPSGSSPRSASDPYFKPYPKPGKK